MKTQPPSVDASLEVYAPRIIALSLLAFLLLHLLTGCQGATALAARNHPAGLYRLVSIDGKMIPCDLSHEGASLVVQSGSISFNADGTCRSLTVFSVPPRRDIHREVNATYTQNGKELAIQWLGAGTTKGRLNGNVFTMNNEGLILVYRK